VVVGSAIQAEIDSAKARVDRLTAYDLGLQQHQIDAILAKVSEIREKRLLGQHADAYHLAKAALGCPVGMEHKP
jgi:hypothetical protein